MAVTTANRQLWKKRLLLVLAFGGMVVLSLAGPMAWALMLGRADVHKAAAAAVVVSAGGLACPLTLFLLVVAGAVWGTHRARKALPERLRSWQKRAKQMEHRSRDLGMRAARPVIQAYALSAALRRLWQALRH